MLASKFVGSCYRGPATALLALVASLFGLPVDAQSTGVSKRSNAQSAASISITAALVLPDMTVRPLPLLSLEVASEADTAQRFAVRTALDGKVSQSVPAGRYRVRSVAPAVLGDSSYVWDVAVDVAAGGAAVELTNANAVVTARAPAPKQVARQIAPEREVFERVKRGVLRVEAGLGHGSGFLIEEHGGLVVTNDHVVKNATTASVYLDSVTRVPAQVVLRDRDADLALLRIPTGRGGDCPRLPLVRPKQGEPIVVAGERLLAIGFPLNQEITLTTGIASSIREGAIISDVNINHGNSGGPMLNLAGEVVGVNTFGDFTSQGGPGVSGSIAIHRLLPLLDKVPTALAGLSALEDRDLPAVPQDVYPLSLIKSLADTATASAYRFLIGRSAGRFTLTVTTPVLYRVRQKAEENDVAKDRKKRESRAGLSEDERYAEMRLSRDWEQYVGEPSTPVVTIAIAPKIAETVGSALTRGLQAGLTGYSTMRAKFRFQGDVRGARFFRNGVEVEPIRGGHGPQKVQVENQWVELKDVADMGYYVLPPNLFEPDSAGAPAIVSVVIQDLKNPNQLSAVDIWGETSARVWNDFGPYLENVRPTTPFRRADPTIKARKVSLSCDPKTGTCAKREG